MNRQHGQFKFDELSHLVIGCAFEVHSLLGPGLPKSTYVESLCHELTVKRLRIREKVELPETFTQFGLATNDRVDLVVEDQLLVEAKSVDQILDIHEAKVLATLECTRIKIGLLINFNVVDLKKGIKRFVT